MPKDSTEQRFYLGVHNWLYGVKEVWRNPSTHEIACFYNERQATDILNNVIIAIRGIAEPVDEQGIYQS